LQGVTSGFDWDVDGFVQFEAPDRLAVDRY
jgi:hypothetical protein